MSSISAGTTSGTALVSTGDTTGTLDLKTGASATTALSINASQNVGIGTSSPTAKLDVYGTGTQYILLRNATTTNQIAVDSSAAYFGSVTNSPVVFTSNNTERARIDSSGNLLVGTTSGSYRMNVTGADNVALFNSSGTGPYIALSSAGTRSAYIQSDNSGGLLVVNERNTPMVFYTNNLERARITNGGYFKATSIGTYINVAGTYHEFNANSAGDWAIRVKNSAASSPYGMSIHYSGASPNNGSSEFFYCYDTSAARAYILSNGGIANFQANNVNLSDRREKTNFSPAGEYLSKICAIPVQTFNYIDQNMEDDPGITLGVVAQDVQAVAPELVMESDWAAKDQEPKMRLSIYQTDLQYALMKCIQEQQTIIESLTARIAALESK